MRQQRPRRVIHRRSAEREQRRGTEIETIREPLLLFYQKLVQCCEWEVGGGGGEQGKKRESLQDIREDGMESRRLLQRKK